MLRNLCLLIVAAALVDGQVPSLPYETYLSPNYRLSWGLSEDSITIQLDAKTLGWVSLALLSDDGTMLDVWWGGYDEDYGLAYIQDGYASFANLTAGPRYPDTFQNLQGISIEQQPFSTNTTIRFTRLFQTIDIKQDNILYNNTRQTFFWSYGAGDLASSPAVSSGLAQLNLRPQ